jgi:hypothetical protein
VVPPGRDTWLLSGCLLLVCLGGLIGIRWVGRVVPGLSARRLVVLAVVGFGLAALPAVAGGLSVMEWVDAHLPGGGLLRDSQKWVALLAVAEAIGLASLVNLLRNRWRSYGASASWWLMSGAVLTPLAVTVSLAWGLSGRLEPVSYPADWSAIAAAVDNAESHPRHGDIAVLPWSIYRQYGWNDDRPVLDPAPRFLDGDVVIADTLVVGDRAVAGEGARAASIGVLLSNGGDVSAGLRRLGIGLVVVEHGTPGVGEKAELTGDRVYDGRWLELWVLGAAAPGSSVPGDSGPGTSAQALMVAGDLAAGGAFVGSVGLLVAARFRRYTRR